MIESVLRIREPFEKITQEFVEEEFVLLKEIYDALQPIKVLTKKLCSDNANLLTADVAYKVTFDWLKSQNSKIAKDLYTALRER